MRCEPCRCRSCASIAEAARLQAFGPRAHHRDHAHPGAGFLANGPAYVAGEHDVDARLGSVRRATALADASREFKSAVGDIQAAARSFAVRAAIELPADAQRRPSRRHRPVHHHPAAEQRRRQTNLAAIERTLARLQGNFGELRNEYERLGADSDTGIRAKLRQAAAEVERIISLDMSWLTEAPPTGWSRACCRCAASRPPSCSTATPTTARASTPNSSKFNKILDGVIAAEILKTQIRQTVRDYADAFDTWLASDREIATASPASIPIRNS